MEPEHVDELKKLIQNAEKNRLVAGVNDILQYLKANGYVRSQRLEPHLVGCHMENRDGLGVSGMDAINLLEGMHAVGFDRSKPDPIAVEIGDMEEAYKFQVKLNQESKGKVPLMKKVDLLYLSLSASHTNVALRAVNAGVASNHPELSWNGKLSLEQIKSRDAAMAEACASGLVWRVISRAVMQEVPQLAHLIQAAQNASGQLARGEHEVQMHLDQLHWCHFSSFVSFFTL